MAVELVPERAARALRDSRRLLILGNCGSGKSTLARQLAPRMGLPLIHLDREYWRTGWVEPSVEEWRDRQVPELIARESWIMDGNYSATLPERLARADGVLLLDLPRLVCLGRVLARVVFRGPRPDLAPGCPERFDAAFVGWVWGHPERSRSRVLELLDEASDRLPVAALRDASQVERFLGELG